MLVGPGAQSPTAVEGMFHDGARECATNPVVGIVGVAVHVFLAEVVHYVEGLGGGEE